MQYSQKNKLARSSSFIDLILYKTYDLYSYPVICWDWHCLVAGLGPDPARRQETDHAHVIERTPLPPPGPLPHCSLTPPQTPHTAPLVPLFTPPVWETAQNSGEKHRNTHCRVIPNLLRPFLLILLHWERREKHSTLKE